MSTQAYSDFKRSVALVILSTSMAFGLLVLAGCQREMTGANVHDETHDHFHSGVLEDDLELAFPDSDSLNQMSCTKAKAEQIAMINEGNKKLAQFMSRCLSETKNSSWCEQLTRPNPQSRGTFECTYGSQQPHSLIHPDESTWAYAINAVHLVNELDKRGIKICEIYNWWRPEPYNRNVGGAKTRHPFGTSVDVRFCSKDDQAQAFKILCSLRKEGWLRAIGYYAGTALHFGVGDSIANTWGRECETQP